jgi:hypothetical protein
MATGDNPITPLFEPGRNITCAVTAAVGAGKFVSPSGDFQGGPALVVATPLVSGNLIQVAHTTAATRALGVALWDAATSGDVVGVITGGIVPVVSSGAIAAGAQVEVGAAGVAVTIASGIAVGMAVSAAAGNIVYVKLY